MARRADFAATVTAVLFVSGALLLWAGWVLLPARIGEFFEPPDFGRVHEHLRLWIWLFRAHLFGHLTAAMALVALAARRDPGDARVLTWPGLAVACAGLIVSAVAAAFYYHFGAWGAIDMAGAPMERVEQLVRDLRVPTEYVTCLVRFGRVFLGLGLTVLALGLLRGKLLPPWLAAVAAALGVAAMAVTMAFPDDLHFYDPIFHMNAAWLFATGVTVHLQAAAARPDPEGD
jgi:hypothetical protein